MNIIKKINSMLFLIIILSGSQAFTQIQPEKSFTIESAPNQKDAEVITFTSSISNKFAAAAIVTKEPVRSKVIVFDLTTSEELLTIEIIDFIPSIGVFSLAFSPDDQILITGMQGAVKLWNLTNGTEIMTIHTSTWFRIGWPRSFVNEVVFSPDGKTFVTSELDGKVQFWDSLTGKEKLNSIDFDITPDSLSFSKAKPWLLAKSRSDASIVSAETSQIIRTYSGGAATFSDDGLYLFIGENTTPSDNNGLVINKWDIEKNEIVSTSNKFTASSMDYLINDGRFLVCDNDDGLYLKNIKNSEQTMEFIADSVRNFTNTRLSNNGNKLLTSANGQFFIFDVSDLTSGLKNPY